MLNTNNGNKADSGRQETVWDRIANLVKMVTGNVRVKEDGNLQEQIDKFGDSFNTVSDKVGSDSINISGVDNLVEAVNELNSDLNAYTGAYDYDMSCLQDWLTSNDISDYFYLSEHGDDMVRTRDRGFTTIAGVKFLFFHSISKDKDDYIATWMYVTPDNSIQAEYIDNFTDYGAPGIRNNLTIYTYKNEKVNTYALASAFINKTDVKDLYSTVTEPSGIEHKLYRVQDVPGNVLRMITQLILKENYTLEKIQNMCPNMNNAVSTVETIGETIGETEFYNIFSPYFIYSNVAGDVVTAGGRGGTRESSEPAFYGMAKINSFGTYPFCGVIIGLSEAAVTLSNLTQYGTNYIYNIPEGIWINLINKAGQWSINNGCEVKRGNSTLKTYAVMTTDTVVGTTLKDLAKGLAVENKNLETEEKGSVFGAINELALPAFTQASERKNIISGDKLPVIFGKIAKFFTDLKTVAFSGSYNDLIDTPSGTDLFVYSAYIYNRVEAGEKIAIPMTGFKRMSDKKSIESLALNLNINEIRYAGAVTSKNIKNYYSVSHIHDNGNGEKPINNPVIETYIALPFYNNRVEDYAQIIMYFPEGYNYSGMLQVDVYMELEL